MIEIKVTEKNDDSFDIYFKARATDRSKYIEQVKAILDDLYHTDEDSFVKAVLHSDFAEMVMSK